ncbi:Detected protein of confused Function [Hibiscus syriacus]|uniref:Detected protein of confused Function n=2 Tax=Hibiscus syriacus TaxID=106335 RepID=A0A6A2XBG9_HIBSY|nr:Detected protein of confused Function [Hibiscus syriacus]
MSMQRTSVDNASFDLSPRNKDVGDVFLSPEYSDNIGSSPNLETETPVLDLDNPRDFRSADKDDYEQEIKYLRNMVRMLSEKERNLEIQLLEYYGLKEQETAVLELQNQLKINKMEAKIFTRRIESLQSENQRLEAQVSDHARVIAELEAARSKIKVFKRKLRQDAEQSREQILSLQKRVSRLQEQELKAAATNQDSESNLQRLKVLEVEAEELREANRRLQLENSQLSQKLQSTKILADSDNPEAETSEMMNNLREENQKLTNQNEKLKAQKFTDVEELMYLRWVNACLRYELKNNKPRAGKRSRDLSKTLSPRSEARAKKLVLEYAKAEATIADKGKTNNTDSDCDQWLNSSPQPSIAIDYSSGDNSSTSKPVNKTKFFKKLRKLLRGKDTSKTDEDAESPTSKSSSTTSLDIPRGSTKDPEKFRRNSDFGSYGFKRLMSGKDDDLESPVETQKFYQDSDSILKSDLFKFSEVLKQPAPKPGKGKIQKAASIK